MTETISKCPHCGIYNVLDKEQSEQALESKSKVTCVKCAKTYIVMPLLSTVTALESYKTADEALDALLSSNPQPAPTPVGSETLVTPKPETLVTPEAAKGKPSADVDGEIYSVSSGNDPYLGTKDRFQAIKEGQNPYPSLKVNPLDTKRRPQAFASVGTGFSEED